MSFPLKIISSFPDFKQPGFNRQQYDAQFRQFNVLIHARAKQIQYGQHWGPLSVKAVISGAETYEVDKRVYMVTPLKYLLLNEGTYYSSYIDAPESVESFTVNFTKSLVNDAWSAQHDDAEDNMDYLVNEQGEVFFPETLNLYSEDIKSILQQMLYMAGSAGTHERLEECYYHLLEKIMCRQLEAADEIKSVKAKKSSTQKELYKRLHFAKDYIDSCYQCEINLDQLAALTYMNAAYFLRKFKEQFRITPRQYIILKRMEKARELLEAGNKSVTEVCREVGYSNLTSFSKLFKFLFNRSPATLLRKGE